MKIDFNNLDIKEIKEFKGGLGELLLKKFEDESCKIMRSTLTKGSTIGLHKHEDDCEILYILSGKGYAVCDGKREDLSKGIVHYCPKDYEHTVINTGDTNLEMYAIVIKEKIIKKGEKI